MTECYYCGAEAGYIRTNKKNGKIHESSIPKKYCNKKCQRQSQYTMKGENKIFKISYSPYASGREKTKRKNLLDNARMGNETAILELRLRYGLKVSNSQDGEITCSHPNK